MDVFAPFKKRYILLHIFINKTDGIYSNIVFSKNNAFTETEDYDEISKDFKKKYVCEQNLSYSDRVHKMFSNFLESEDENKTISLRICTRSSSVELSVDKEIDTTFKFNTLCFTFENNKKSVTYKVFDYPIRCITYLDPLVIEGNRIILQNPKIIKYMKAGSRSIIETLVISVPYYNIDNIHVVMTIEIYNSKKFNMSVYIGDISRLNGTVFECTGFDCFDINDMRKMIENVLSMYDSTYTIKESTERIYIDLRVKWNRSNDSFYSRSSSLSKSYIFDITMLNIQCETKEKTVYSNMFIPKKMLPTKRLFLVDGHGYEMIVGTDKRSQLPKGVVLVVFSNVGIPITVEMGCVISEVFKNPQNAKYLADPVAYENILKNLFVIDYSTTREKIPFRIYTSNDMKIPELHTNLFMYHNNRYGKYITVKKSGVYSNTNIPNLHRRLIPVNTHAKYDNYSDICQTESVGEIKEDDYDRRVHEELFRGNVYEPANNYDNIDSLKNRIFKLDDIIKTVGNGVYYYNSCRSQLEDNIVSPSHLETVKKFSDEQQASRKQKSKVLK
jgi:hypothetical protein